MRASVSTVLPSSAPCQMLKPLWAYNRFSGYPDCYCPPSMRAVVSATLPTSMPYQAPDFMCTLF